MTSFRNGASLIKGMDCRSILAVFVLGARGRCDKSALSLLELRDELLVSFIPVLPDVFVRTGPDAH